MISVFEKINITILKFLRILVFVLLCIMTVFTFSEVLTRYLNIKPLLRNSEELVKFSLVWLTFTGAAICVSIDEHPRLSYFVEKLPEKIRRVVTVISNILVYVFMLSMIFYSLMFLNTIGGQLSQGLRIPLAVVYPIIPIGFFLMVSLYTYYLMYNKKVEDE